MTACFETLRRALKPGRWMTVEFHNSKNTCMELPFRRRFYEPGLSLPMCEPLDKQQGTFKQIQGSWCGQAGFGDLCVQAYRSI